MFRRRSTLSIVDERVRLLAPGNACEPVVHAGEEDGGNADEPSSGDARAAIATSINLDNEPDISGTNLLKRVQEAAFCSLLGVCSVVPAACVDVLSTCFAHGFDALLSALLVSVAVEVFKSAVPVVISWLASPSCSLNPAILQALMHQAAHDHGVCAFACA